jgi:putative transposase
MPTLRRRYPSDLSDAEWALLAPLLPPATPGGRPRSTDLREVLNAVGYWLRGGVAWHALPHDFPAWQTVYH